MNEIIGRKFGRWTVIAETEPDVFLCQCAGSDLIRIRTCDADGKVTGHD